MSSPAGRALGKAYESGIFPLKEDAALVFIPVQFPAYSDVYSGTPVHSGLFRLIPAYSAVFRLVRAHSGTPVVPVAIRCISAAIRRIPVQFRDSGDSGCNSAYLGRISAASAVCFSRLRRTSPDGPRWPRAGCWPPTRLRCGRGRSSATPCRESPRQSCSRARRLRACGRLRLP